MASSEFLEGLVGAIYLVQSTASNKRGGKETLDQENMTEF
jgi:hypothetical protein